jgi:hypothetical protein
LIEDRDFRILAEAACLRVSELAKSVGEYAERFVDPIE